MHGGGMHNRTWEIQIKQRASEQVSDPLKLDNFSEFSNHSGESPKGCLSIRHFIGSTDRFSDPQPGIWVRSAVSTWTFLSDQGITDASEGDIVVVPRSKFKAGDAVEYGEGYFTWSPGMPEWVASE